MRTKSGRKRGLRNERDVLSRQVKKISQGQCNEHTDFKCAIYVSLFNIYINRSQLHDGGSLSAQCSGGGSDSKTQRETRTDISMYCRFFFRSVS